MGGGGSSSGGTTQQQNQYSSLSPWAAPYVTSMLGAAQSQVFNTDPSTGNITGINPYNAFGAYNPNTGGQYGMTPSDVMAAQSSVAGFSPLQNQAFQSAGNLQTPGQFAPATQAAMQGTFGALGTAPQAQGYGAMGAGYGGQAAGYGQGMGAQAAGYGQGAGSQIAGAGQDYASQIAQAGQAFGQQATNPAAVQAYMNPYVQQSLNPQLELLSQQTGAGIMGTQAGATQAGAFGGTRQALQSALAQQAGNLAAQQAIGQGYNTAYQQALANMQAAGQQGLAGAQGAAGAGLQGLTSGAGLGLQGITSGAGLGLQGLAAGMQGAGVGLQGLGTAQAGYGAGMQGAGTLGNLGTGQLAAQQGILGTQSTLGAQQQTQAQNIINQAMQNYATAQQYPMSQLTNLKNLATGIPMTDVTTTMQQATPSTASQLAGLGTAGIAGLGLYNAMNPSAKTGAAS